MIDGWNSGSGDAIAAPLADDSDFVGFDGTHKKGRQQIAEFHQMLFDNFANGSRLVGKVRSIRFLGSDVAIMIAVGGTANRTIRYRTRAKLYQYSYCYKT